LAGAASAAFATSGSGLGAGTGAAALAAGAGGAAFFGAVASSSPEISAITVPTFTPSDPSGIMIREIVPSSTASNSIVALSVSISARRSPDATTSPSLTSHLASVPSSIVGESAGIFNSIGIGTLPPGAHKVRHISGQPGVGGQGSGLRAPR
jgi:hypothetical protein